MCGIIAYINFLCDRKRSEVIEILLSGLARLEYRGYDSSGMYPIHSYCRFRVAYPVCSAFISCLSFVYFFI